MRKYTKISVFVMIGFMFGIMAQPTISDDNIFSDIRKFNQVLQSIHRNYVEDVDSGKLVEDAIRGMLKDLDVHSVYITAEEMQKVRENFQGSFEGIGIQYDIIDDTLIVVSPIVGGPSEELGIMSNDKIIKIDGESAVGITKADVPKRLKGPGGTKVVLDIMRDNNPELLTFEITRAKIPIYSVDAKFMIDGTDIGVVKVNRFAGTTHRELTEALRELKAKGMKKLVLDLRGNPGGYLEQAYEMADEFVKNDTIVFTKGRMSDANEFHIGRKGQPYESIPMIVLINAGSASASEIVSGAIQDLDRGLVIGETSFGKGLVQRQYPLDDGSAYRLTIAKYYTPSGRCIQRPYEDKDKYRHMVGRLTLEEGSYIDNAYDKIEKQVKKINEVAKEGEEIHLDSLPMHYTKNGRVVLGGGGITPDVIIKQDTITDMSVDFRRKNLYMKFINDFMQTDEGRKIKDKYSQDFDLFKKEFLPDSEIMDDFRKLAEKNEIKWSDEDYNTDQDYIKVNIKLYIAQSIWNRSVIPQIFYQQDRQMMRAVELFPEAEKMMLSTK